jgi:hypothetical protein
MREKKEQKEKDDKLKEPKRVIRERLIEIVDLHQEFSIVINMNPMLSPSKPLPIDQEI